MPDTIPSDDAVFARCLTAANGEHQLPSEGDLQHPAHHLTVCVVGKIGCL